MKSFRIKKEYLTSVPYTVDSSIILSDGFTMEGKIQGSTDHPEFTKLRNNLEKLGYIKTERTYWNGDRVLKPFSINGMKLDKGQQFCCASALGNQISVRKIYIASN